MLKNLSFQSYMITTKSLVVITEKSALINHVGVFIALVAKIIMIFFILSDLISYVPYGLGIASS